MDNISKIQGSRDVLVAVFPDNLSRTIVAGHNPYNRELFAAIGAVRITPGFPGSSEKSDMKLVFKNDQKLINIATVVVTDDKLGVTLAGSVSAKVKK